MKVPCCRIQTANPVSPKILVFGLWWKMLSTNQIRRLFKLYYLKKQLRFEVAVLHKPPN